MRIQDRIIVTSLRRIEVSGGDVLRAMKKSDQGFRNFGEAYFSIVDSKSVKAWKRHTRMTLNLVVPVGLVRFVFVDNSLVGGEQKFALTIGEDNYKRITVPPGIWFGFMGLANGPSLVLNIADLEHDPREVERKDTSSIEFDWEADV